MTAPYNFRRLEKRWHDLLTPSLDLGDRMPEYYLREYGQDAVRMYALFSGSLPGRSRRDEELADGILQYLRRYWKIANVILDRTCPDSHIAQEIPGEARELTYTVNERIDRSMWNTAAAAMMEGLNPLRKAERGQSLMTLMEERLYMKNYILLSAPFTPYIAQELWMRYAGPGQIEAGNVMDAVWPEVDESDRFEDMIRLPVCVDGKKRTEIRALYGLSREQAVEGAAAALGRRMPSSVAKIIYVPGRMLNFVTK